MTKGTTLIYRETDDTGCVRTQEAYTYTAAEMAENFTPAEIEILEAGQVLTRTSKWFPAGWTKQYVDAFRAANLVFANRRRKPGMGRKRG